METEQSKYKNESGSENWYGEIKKFRELYQLLRSQRADKEYQDAYEDAAQLAGGFVEAKNRSSWDPAGFTVLIKEKYPNVSDGFIGALKRCIENHDPVVNIPAEPLWE